MISFGGDLKNFASHNQTKSGLDLTCLQASGKETSQLMNGTMQYRPRLLWLSTPRNSQDPSQGHLLVFLERWGIFSKTINDSHIDLDKFPACKVRQLAKKMESSKVTAKHIKQVASDPRGSDQFDEALTYRPPSKQAQEEKTLCDKFTNGHSWCRM